MLFLFSLLSVAILIVYLAVESLRNADARNKLARQHGTKPPPAYSPKSFLGLALFREARKAVAEHRGIENNTERFAKFGNTYSAHVLGKSLIYTIDPENVKAVLSTRFGDFGLGQRLAAFGPLIGRGIFTSDGQHWEHSRAMVRPNFARSQVAELDSLEEHIQNLISVIPKDGSTVNLQTLFYNLTFDTATEFLVGKSVACQLAAEGSSSKEVAEAFDYAETQIAVRLRIGPLKALYFDAKFDRSCRILHKAFDELIDQARKDLHDTNSKGGAEGRYVFVKEMLKVEPDLQQVRAEALNVLIAGRDTTAGLLSNIFHALARNPRVWAKLQAEISRLEGRKPDYATLRGDMPYLKAVLNEGLRLYPSVPANTRFANKDTVLPTGGGEDGKSPVLVPKGAIVMYSVWAMHRRTDIYGANAEEFYPERWESGNSDGPLRPGWGYLPFNGGPRICLGQQYALTEAGYTIVRLLQHFETIENRDSQPWEAHIGVTLSSLHGTKVSLGYRSS